MAVMEVGLLTGFEPSGHTITDDTILKNEELEDRKYVFYFDEVCSYSNNHVFE